MSKQVDEILTSLKDRPEEWSKYTQQIIFSEKLVIEDFDKSKTETEIIAYHRTMKKGYYCLQNIFLSYQNKWVLERAVSEWMERRGK